MPGLFCLYAKTNSVLNVIITVYYTKKESNPCQNH